MKKSNKSVGIIGSGFSGLAAASILAKHGCDVTIFEKNETIGGRARELKLGAYLFDMGPSWYWMPEVFESYFNLFGHSASDFYDLKRLDPAYRVFKGPNEYYDVPASFEELCKLFESLEKGSAAKLIHFLEKARIKYELGIGKFARKPSLSIFEFLEMEIVKNLFKLDLFQPISKSIDKSFKHPVLRELLKFPVLFLGAKPENTPALFSMMNYADLKLGTWYPSGGMIEVVRAFERIALKQGVKIFTKMNVEKLIVENERVEGLIVNGDLIKFDMILASSDYHFTEMELLDPPHRSYTKKYWDSRQLSPSAIMFYIGLDCKIPGVIHHNLFFDEDFNQHAADIYDQKQWPKNPLFYLSSSSKSDESVSPNQSDNLVILLPVSAGLSEKKETHEHYFQLICDRINMIVNFNIKPHVVEFQSYGVKNFMEDYNAFKGNAYGLANTLKQTAILRPAIKSKKLNNLYFTGQLTVPGPGVPPAIISGELVALEMLKHNN